MVSLLLQSVKNTASHPCPVSLIAVKVVLLTQCFTFIETGVGAGKKKLKSSLLPLFHVEKLVSVEQQTECSCNYRMKHPC